MKVRNTNKSPAVPRFHRRRWFWMVSVFFVLLTALLILTPYGIDYGIEYWLRSQGADQARVSNIDFNPFTRKLNLYGLDVTTADNRVMKIDRAELLFSWSPFLKKRLHVREMEINGLDLTIEQLPQYRWRIGGITASLLKDQQSKTFTWGYQLSRLQINNGKIRFLTPKANVSLKINHARLSRVISWQPEQIARFDFSGQINGSELRVEADIAPFAVQPKFNGKLKLTALDLASLNRLATPHLDMLAGRLNLDVALEGIQKSEADFRLAQRGRMSLQQVHLKKENTEIKENQLVWNGTLTVQQSETGKQQLTAEGQIEGSRFDMALPSHDLQLRHDGISWKGKFNFIHNEGGADINTDSEMSLNNFHLETAGWSLAEKTLTWKGTLQSAVPLKSEDFRLSSNGLLESDQLVMNMPARNLSLKYGAQFWEGKIDVRRQAAQLQIDFGRKLVLNDILIETPELAFAKKQAIWEGDLQMTTALESPLAKISSKGRLTGKGLELALIQTKAIIQQDGLNWVGKIDYKQNDSDSEIMIDGKTSLPKITVKSPGAGLSEEIVKWNGMVRMSIPQKSDALQLNVEGQLEGGLLKMDLIPRNVIFNNSGFVWNGKLGYQEQGADTGISADGRVNINGLQIKQAKQNLGLLELKQLTLNGIKMESLHQANVSSAQVKGLNLMNRYETQELPAARPPLFSLSGADFENVTFSADDNLGMDSMILEDAVLYLHHTKDGKWIYLSDIDNMLGVDGAGESESPTQSTSRAEPAAGNEPDTEKFRFRVDNLQFAGNSALRFVDETVSPTYSTKLNFAQAVVSDLDNSRPKQPSPLKLSASVGKYTRINLQGNIQPFTDRFSMDVTGNIEALELPPLSPYVVDSIGYNFISGKLDADVDLKIIHGKLQGESDFRVSNLKVKAAEKRPLSGQSESLKIPLESTLRILRDRNNNVDLKVPISGDITDPQFSFSDAINQAVVKALSVASLSYLKYMLGPYGIAIGVAELAIKAVPGIRLKPVVFDPGSSDLNEDAEAYLQQVAAIMKERSNLKVAVCGMATEKDRSFLSKQDLNQGAGASSIDDKLLELARKRAEVIEDHLVSQYEIKNNRIFICKPQLDQDAEGNPRVDLLV